MSAQSSLVRVLAGPATLKCPALVASDMHQVHGGLPIASVHASIPAASVEHRIGRWYRCPDRGSSMLAPLWGE